jgi:hypothetical protein
MMVNFVAMTVLQWFVTLDSDSLSLEFLVIDSSDIIPAEQALSSSIGGLVVKLAVAIQGLRI